MNDPARSIYQVPNLYSPVVKVVFLLTHPDKTKGMIKNDNLLMLECGMATSYILGS